MTAPDPDAVQVMARALHKVFCLPGATPQHRYSAAHQRRDARLAGLVLTESANADYEFSPTQS